MKYYMNLEKTNTEGKYLATYITKNLLGNLNEGKVKVSLTEKEVIELLPIVANNKSALKALDQFLQTSSSNIEKRLSNKGHKVKIAIAGVAVLATTFGAGYVLGTTFNKVVEPTKTTDTSDIEKEVIMTEEIMHADLKEHVAYLASKGVEVSEETLTPFYYVNNAAYFNEEVTAEFIAKGLIPDTTDKMLEGFQSVADIIDNHNFSVYYSQDVKTEAQIKEQLIEYNHFVKNAIDKEIVQILDNNNVAMFFSKDKAAAELIYNNTYELLIGVGKTNLNNSFGEMTAGGQHLARYGNGTMMSILGVDRQAGRETITKTDENGKTIKVTKNEELIMLIANERNEISTYMESDCNLPTGKQR